MNQNQMDISLIPINTFPWLMIFENSSVLRYRCMNMSKVICILFPTIQLRNKMLILKGDDNNIMIQRGLESNFFFNLESAHPIIIDVKTALRFI